MGRMADRMAEDKKVDGSGVASRVRQVLRNGPRRRADAVPAVISDVQGLAEGGVDGVSTRRALVKVPRPAIIGAE